MSAEDRRGKIASEIILPRECQSLPPVDQERLKSYLTYLKEIEGSWFKIRTPKELKESVPAIQTASQRLWDMDTLKFFKEKKRSWREALGKPMRMVWKLTRADDTRKKPWRTEREWIMWKIWYETRSIAMDAIRRTALEASRGVVWETDYGLKLKPWRALRKAAREAHRTASILAANVAGGGAVWEIAKEETRIEENPFLPKLALYELGAFRIDIQETNGEEKLFVDLLLRTDKKTFLGCLAFGDGESGEIVPYFHRIGEDCSQREKTLKQLFTSLRHFL